MKDNIRSISKFFPFNIYAVVSYSMIVTLLLTVVIVMGSGGSYQLENVEAQLTNTSSVSELIEKGNSLGNLGKYEDAIIWYDKALEIDPTNVDALISKTLLLATHGNGQDALTSLDKALTIDPTNEIILNLKSLLQK